MFGKGSRYRNLPETSALTASGERVRGKNIRPLSLRPGRWSHLVRQGERLDLLAYQYYGDSIRWWLIADANPEPAFPLELTAEGPLARESLQLFHAVYQGRLYRLVTGLAGLPGAIQSAAVVHEDFLEATLAVAYTGPTGRAAVLTAFDAGGFHLLDAFGWTGGSAGAEAFTVDDPAAKQDWQALRAALADMPGVMEVVSLASEMRLEITYNSLMAPREQVIARIESRGFVVDPAGSSKAGRAGSQIVIPPNEVA